MTFGTQNSIIIMELKIKGGERELSPKTGRPTDRRKEHDLKVRVTPEQHKKITDYSEGNGITKAETVRRAIDTFLPDEK